MPTTEQLPGLRAWDVQRRNRRRRWSARVVLLVSLMTLACAFAPDRFNPAVHAGLVEPRGVMRPDALQQIAAVAEAREFEQAKSRRGLPPLTDTATAPLPAAAFPVADLHCLAKAVYFEARGESIEGQIAVAQVVMNRQRIAAPGTSICQIVYAGAERGEKCQFSFACHTHTLPSATSRLWLQAAWIAEEVAAERAFLRELAHALHYHTVAVKPVWRLSLRPIRRIGQHIFYLSWSAAPDFRMISKAPPRWDEASNHTMIDEEQLGPATAHIVPTSGTSPVKRAPQMSTGKTGVVPTTPTFNPFGSAADGR